VISSVPTKLKNSTDTTKKDNSPLPTHKSSLSLSDSERLIYYTIGNSPVHVDSIAEQSALPVHQVLRILSVLEMNDLITDIGGRNYVIK